MNLYACAGVAWHGDDYQLVAFAVVAQDEDSAISSAFWDLMRRCPISSGYDRHRVSVHAVRQIVVTLSDVD